MNVVIDSKDNSVATTVANLGENVKKSWRKRTQSKTEYAEKDGAVCSYELLPESEC